MWFPSFCLGTAHAKTKTQAQPTATSACTQMGPLLGLYCIKFAQAMRLLICQPSLQLRTAKCTRNIKSSNFCSHLFLSTSLSLSSSISVVLPFSRTDKPICRPDQKKIYGVARSEAAEIVCEVDAFPPPENFKWSFNNTAETFDMPQSGFRPHSAQGSTLTYTPVKVSTDYVSPFPFPSPLPSLSLLHPCEGYIYISQQLATYLGRHLRPYKVYIL